jgi:hypothetical protein
MTTIRLSIEGQKANDAATDFFELPNISGTWEPVNETRRDPTLEIVNAVAIFSTITGITIQQIHSWYASRKKDKRVDKVVMICKDGKHRLMMNDASLEDIRKFFEKC